MALLPLLSNAEVDKWGKLVDREKLVLNRKLTAHIWEHVHASVDKKSKKSKKAASPPPPEEKDHDDEQRLIVKNVCSTMRIPVVLGKESLWQLKSSLCCPTTTYENINTKNALEVSVFDPEYPMCKVSVCRGSRARIYMEGLHITMRSAPSIEVNQMVSKRLVCAIQHAIEFAKIPTKQPKKQQQELKKKQAEEKEEAEEEEVKGHDDFEDMDDSGKPLDTQRDLWHSVEDLNWAKTYQWRLTSLEVQFRESIERYKDALSLRVDIPNMAAANVAQCLEYDKQVNDETGRDLLFTDDTTGVKCYVNKHGSITARGRQPVADMRRAVLKCVAAMRPHVITSTLSV